MISCPNVKVNLGLSVLRRRPDGFHDLETLFVPYFGFHDTLEIIAGDDYSRTSARLFEGALPPTIPRGLSAFPTFAAQKSRPGRPADAGFASLKSEIRAFSNDAEGGTSLQDSTGVPPTLANEPAGKAGRSSDAADVCGDTDFLMRHDGCPRIKQAISDDAKVMVTIARAEGVDWDPLKDLTVKAYRLLDAAFNLPPVKIFLEKTSPVGAGLGGGSADAAFALKMLNELFALNLDDAALATYAARLGSDCAFFIYNRPMLGTGRGDILEPYPLEGIDFSGRSEDKAASYDLRVRVPEGIAVSTADAYRGITPREISAKKMIPLMEALSRPVEGWRGTLVNDFETTVFAKYPLISEVKDSLYSEGAVYASMSGSGSSVFGIFPR